MPTTKKTETPSLEERLAHIEKVLARHDRRIAALLKGDVESARERDRSRPPQCIKGNDPKTCGDASLYNYVKGNCGGAACLAKNAEQQAKTRANRKAQAAAPAAKVAAPRKRAAKAAEAPAAKPVAKRAAPAKAAPARKAPVKKTAA